MLNSSCFLFVCSSDKLVKAIKHARFIEEAPKHIDAALGKDQ